MQYNMHEYKTVRVYRRKMLRNRNNAPFFMQLFNTLRLWSSERSSIGIIVFGVYILVYTLCYLLASFNNIHDVFFIASFYVLPPLVSLLFGMRVLRTRDLHPQIRRASFRLVCAFAFYLLGNVVSFLMQQQPAIVQSFPDPSDIFFLAFYPITMLALLSFPFRPHTAADWLAFALDAAMMMVGMSTLFWQMNLQPLLASDNMLSYEMLSIFGYSIGDLVLLFGITVIILRDPAYGTQTPLFMLAIAFLLLYVTDIRDVYQNSLYIEANTTILDLSWLYMHFMIALSAQYQVWQSRRLAPCPAHKSERSFRIVPYAGVLFGYGLVIKVLSEQWAQPVAKLLLGTVILTLIVITRQIIVMRENDRLRQSLEHTNSQLLELSLTDSLTGVSNRRALEARLVEEIARTQRYNEPLTLIMVDVDFFKAYNDSYGHLAGDVVLQGIAKLLRQYARPVDMVARYGGEEFALLLPNTDLENGIVVAERLRELIAGFEWPHRSITASFGVAASSGPATQADKLQRQADAALYHAKIMRNDVQSLHAV